MPDDSSPRAGSRWDILTETSAGTPMGELLRRYWWPIAGASELAQPGTLPVRLLGENLVLYKDLGGNYGLLDRHCRHRRADLSYGYVEECGLRCNYHGWLYGADGSVLAMPYEDVAHPEACCGVWQGGANLVRERISPSGGDPALPAGSTRSAEYGRAAEARQPEN